MSKALVRRGFEAALETWAAAQNPALQVAWENVPFTPPAGAYVSVNIIPAPTQSNTLDRVHRVYTGIFQVNLHMPAGTGPAAAETLAASLAAAFPINTPIVVSGLRINLLTPMSDAAAIQDAGRYVVPVSCQYRADTV